MNPDERRGQPAIDGVTLDHIGIVTTDVAASVALHRGQLGMTLLREERLERPGLEAILLGLGSTRIELLAPFRKDTPVGSFLERRGPGLHHLAFRVDRMPDAVARLVAYGLEPLTAEPEPGLGGTSTIFFHPRSANGILIELVTPATDAEDR